MLVDTLGLVWGVVVTSGRCAEGAGGKALLTKVGSQLTRLRVLWLDGGFENRIEAWVAERYPFRVEIVKRPKGKQGWELLPQRWVVERTFGWLGRWRGLAKEYDFLPETTEMKIYLALSRLMLRRLTA